MRNLWLAVNIMMHRFLQYAIGVCHPLVLPQMFEPGFHEESFEETALLGGIFEHSPRVGAVATASMRECFKRGKECFAVSRIDSVLDSNENWTSITFNFLGDDGRRPVHGWRA